MDDRVGDLVGISGRFAAGTCHLPILGDLNKVFPRATDLEIQMLTSLPSVLIIPFMLLAGRLSVTGNKFKLLVVGLAVFS